MLTQKLTQIQKLKKKLCLEVKIAYHKHQTLKQKWQTLTFNVSQKKNWHLS